MTGSEIEHLSFALDWPVVGTFITGFTSLQLLLVHEFATWYWFQQYAFKMSTRLFKFENRRS